MSTAASPASSAATSQEYSAQALSKKIAQVKLLVNDTVELAKYAKGSTTIPKDTRIEAPVSEKRQDEKGEEVKKDIFDLKEDVVIDRTTITHAKKLIDMYLDEIREMCSKKKKTRKTIVPSKAVVVSEGLFNFLREAFLSGFQDQSLSQLSKSLYFLMTNEELRQRGLPEVSRIATPGQMLLGLLNAYRNIYEDIKIAGNRIRFNNSMKKHLGPIIDKIRQEKDDGLETEEENIRDILTQNKDQWIDYLEELVEDLRIPGDTEAAKNKREEARKKINEFKKNAPIDNNRRNTFESSVDNYAKLIEFYPRDDNAHLFNFNSIIAIGKGALTEDQVEELKQTNPELYNNVKKYTKQSDKKKQLVETTLRDLVMANTQPTEVLKKVNNMSNLDQETKNIVVAKYLLYLQEGTVDRIKKDVTPVSK